MNQPVRIPSSSSTEEQHFRARCLFHQLHWISFTIIVFGSIIRDVVVSLIVHLLSPGQLGIKIANISKVSTNEFSICFKMLVFPAPGLWVWGSVNIPWCDVHISTFCKSGKLKCRISHSPVISDIDAGLEMHFPIIITCYPDLQNVTKIQSYNPLKHYNNKDIFSSRQLSFALTLSVL